MFSTRYSLNSKFSKKGQILSELLIAIAIGALLATIGAQLIAVSLNASKTSEERSRGLGLAQEGMESMRAIIRGNDASSQGWNRIYLPPDGTGNASSSKGINNPWHPEIISNIWQLASSTETISLAGKNYTRKIIIENVCRNDTGGAIAGASPCAPGIATDDPTTQKITVIVSKTDIPDITLSAYFTRYPNESMLQTNWSGGFGNGPYPATSTAESTYGNGTEINYLEFTTSLKLK